MATNGSTVITYEKVRQDADTVRECSRVMQNIFNDFGASMNRLGADDVFAGNASQSLGARFASLKTKFDSYVATIERFSNLISNAASQTEQTENAINRATDNLAG